MLSFRKRLALVHLAVIVVVLTPLFNAMSAHKVPLDNTVAADYHA